MANSTAHIPVTNAGLGVVSPHRPTRARLLAVSAVAAIPVLSFSVIPNEPSVYRVTQPISSRDSLYLRMDRNTRAQVGQPVHPADLAAAQAMALRPFVDESEYDALEEVDY